MRREKRPIPAQISFKRMCAIWFLLGMPLNMFLSLAASFTSVQIRQILLLLACLIYAGGGCVGVMVVREDLALSRPRPTFEYGGTLLLFIGSLVFFLLGLACLLQALDALDTTRLFLR